ncbi:site-specific integrase [Amycolatopsis sp. Poz14]|uniref:site-specific integrase n=1 Tax=Amycolatopsis sp. Poz14 TaxID=1447705 RepID=UPI001EE910E0|nr:site-specific integrase [Amycolatopsis sp. Poz14]MCG3756681.1 site-specific integrase [Amycolatopsis sp. Poz14]
MSHPEIVPAPTRVEALERAAAEYVASVVPANTKRARAADWRAWQDFTAAVDIPEDTATAGALVGFVVWLDEERGLAPNTIDGRLSGAVVGLRARGAEPPKVATMAARAALNGIRRRLAEAGEQRGRGQAPALTMRDLRAITAACPDTLAGYRDRALVLVDFGIAGRRSEVASLLVPDIAVEPEGLVVTVRFGKTGARKVAIPRGTHPGTCPVLAWKAWLDASGITDGPAFRRINRHGTMADAGLSGEAVSEILKRAGTRAGVETVYTGHSARAGLATEARRAGHDVSAIAKQGGWSPRSKALYDYLRTVDQWSDNAVAGIGL